MQAVLPLASLPVWTTVHFGRVEVELRRHPALVRHWTAVSASVKSDATAAAQARFLPTLLAQFLDVVEGAPADPSPLGQDTIVYCERFVELLSDLMSQLGTRRFFRLAVLDQHTVVRCRRSALWGRANAKLFRQLVDVLAHYQDFEIDDHTGLALTLKQMEESHYHRIQVRCVVRWKTWGWAAGLRSHVEAGQWVAAL
jgi:intron-binding protein aquarius